MPAINPVQDADLRRRVKNYTDSQKKNANTTQEGVIVNNCVKDDCVDIHDMYTSLVISENAKMPNKLKENVQSPINTLAPTALIGVGVMSTIALVSRLIRHSAKINLNIDSAKKLEHLTRNVCISDESTQAFYQMVQCPNQKTIMAGTGVITLGAMAFMGKMVVDGIKDVWVKKKEADIQKNLQENLISVETQSFSGKMQILRSMLAQKANAFSEYLKDDSQPPAFKNFKHSTAITSFSANEIKQGKSDKKDYSALKFFAFGAGTVASILLLGVRSLKNLRSGRADLEKYISERQKDISKIVEKSTDKTKESDKNILKNMFKALDSDAEFIKKSLSKLSWTDKKEQKTFLEEALSYANKSTVKADSAMAGDGTPRPAFNSYVNDYKAFFYNYLLDRENPQFKALFLGVTGLTALTYCGESAGTAMKEVQVKKMNAQTELDLQKRLVSTELRNFKSKKDAAIEPLCQEFDQQVQNGKSKEELKTMAENILFEIKNGPPFVYS
ncbi:hypothetical protein KBA27_03555 [bacterium]|nr:hypothetical protein [bacterium]